MNEQILNTFIEASKSDPLTDAQWVLLDEAKQSYIDSRLKQLREIQRNAKYEEERLMEGKFVKHRTRDMTAVTQARLKKMAERKAQQQTITSDGHVNEVKLDEDYDDSNKDIDGTGEPLDEEAVNF